MESLTHQQTLNFAGNLSLPCHKALLNLLPPKPRSRFQKPELPVEIPCSALIIASPAGTCGKGKKKSHGFLDTRFTKESCIRGQKPAARKITPITVNKSPNM